MGCASSTDERLQADKLDALYGEADAASRARLEAHCAACEECRDELRGLSRLRRDLAAWRRPEAKAPAWRRGHGVPSWLLAAAALVLGVSIGFSSGYFSLRNAVREQAARTASLERQQRETARVLEAELQRGKARAPEESALVARIDARVDEKVRQSQAREVERLELLLADLRTRTEAQRRLDLARVAESLSYLDGRHGQQLARTNELMSYVLASEGQKR